MPEFYANTARLAHGPYDFVLELALVQLGDMNSKEDPQVKRVALVRMSPQHALVLSKVFQTQVAAYEATHGPINLSEQFRREMGI